MSRTLRVLLVSVLWAAAPVRAQEPTVSEVAQAREQFEDGMRFARQGRWEEAYQHFRRSYAIVRRPLILLNLASAEEQTRRLVEAAEHYRQFIREATGPREASHRGEAQRALGELDLRIPRARFVVDGLLRGDTVELDGQTISVTALDAPLPINPGDHVLVVRRGAAEVARVPFTMREGQGQDVPVRVERAPAATGDAGNRPAGSGTNGRGISVAGGRSPRGATEILGAGPPQPPGVRGDEGGGVLSSPVFWTVVAVVVVGGVAGGYVLTRDGDEPYDGTLGRVPFR